MTLRITSSSDPIKVSNIILTLYAQPGLGRTSTAFTARNVLLLDFDRGVHRSAYRKDAVQVTSWKDVEAVTLEDLAPYDTIAIDTVGRMLDILTPAIASDDKRNVQRSGQLTLQGFGALKAAAGNWLERIKGAGKDLVILAHMDEQMKGDDVRERLDISGGTKNEIHKLSDAMGRLQLIDGKRMLNFNPSDTAYGKNPAQFEPIAVPHFDKEPLFLAGVIDKIKARLNEMSADATAEQAKMDLWRSQFATLADADGFTAAIAKVKGESDKVKALLNHTAKDKGFHYDKERGGYVGAAA